MKLDPAIRDQVFATVPSLRAFAISLCGNIDRADDLVQETLLRAPRPHQFLPARHQYAGLAVHDLAQPFRSEYRKRRREVEDADGRYAETLAIASGAKRPRGFEDFRAALAKLPSDQREALILVGASGFSYEDAARSAAARSAPSRAGSNRARTRLAELLAIDSVDDFGPDRATRAVLAGGGRAATVCFNSRRRRRASAFAEALILA